MEYTSAPGGGSSGPAGRRKRIAGGLLYVVGSADVGIERMNRINNRFAHTQRQVAEANRRLAVELSNDMAAKLKQGLVRPGASTGRLAEALTSPRNRTSDQFGFGVGSVSYLDNSEAKYWRAIEQGTTHFVGRTLTGLWGSKDGGPTSPFGPPAGERFYPMSGQAARAVLRSHGRTGRTRGVIEQPILPHHYMRDAWDEFDMHVRAAQMIREVFLEAGLPMPRRK